MPPLFEARRSPWRLLMVATLALAFVAIGAWLVGAFGDDRPSGWKSYVAGWAAVIGLDDFVAAVDAHRATAA